jgi:hypothetical protein
MFSELKTGIALAPDKTKTKESCLGFAAFASVKQWTLFFRGA